MTLSPIDRHNRDAWDRRATHGQRFTQPVSDASFGQWCAELERSGWLKRQIQGRRVLLLAAGGGKHSALYAAAGGIVTVVDISPAMLALDRHVAAQRQLQIQTVETSMDDLQMFASQTFDVVIQPVSTCYVPDIARVYREVARVLCAGGLYISQHKQPASLQAAVEPGPRGYELVEPYYREGPLPTAATSLHREEGTLEFLHRWEQLVGELCRAGFVIEDLTEPLHGDMNMSRGSFTHRSAFVPPYVRLTARRKGGEAGRMLEMLKTN